jgi:hypothetical protein
MARRLTGARIAGQTPLSDYDQHRMTVVVAALNKQAAAVAADSAVTFGGKRAKVFNSANKIFALSAKHPVCAAIYGGAELNGMPWETVLKEYRDARGDAICPRVEDRALDLIEWIEAATFLDAGSWVREVLAREFRAVLGDVRRLLANDLESDTVPAFNRALDSVLADYASDRSALDGVPDDLEKDTMNARKAEIDALMDSFFGRYAKDADLRPRFERLALAALTRLPRTGEEVRTGLVVIGFGADEFFPALSAWEIVGVADGYLRRRLFESATISDETPSLVRAFAQTAEAQAFLEGVDPSYQQAVDELLEQVALDGLRHFVETVPKLTDPERAQLRAEVDTHGRELVAGARSHLQERRLERYRAPIYRVAALVPKDELASMAESLCGITAFKRRVSEADETVGGPVDVAVISRGDGLVWVKRKHYFPAELNPRTRG